MPARRPNDFAVKNGLAIVELYGRHGEVTKHTVIDVCDIPALGMRRWSCGGTYVTAHDAERQRRIILHRVITQAPDGMVVDHINNDPLDNRRANLRVCTQTENLRNRERARRDGRRRGVRPLANGRWMASMYLTFDTEEEALAQRIAWETEHHGEFAFGAVKVAGWKP